MKVENINIFKNIYHICTSTCFFLNDWSWLKVGLLKPTENVCKQTKPIESVWSQFQMTKNNHSRPKWIASSRLKLTQTNWNLLKSTEPVQSTWVGFSWFESVSVGLSWFQSTWGDSLGSTVVVFRKPTFSQLQSFKKKQVALKFNHISLNNLESKSMVPELSNTVSDAFVRLLSWF